MLRWNFRLPSMHNSYCICRKLSAAERREMCGKGPSLKSTRHTCITYNVSYLTWKTYVVDDIISCNFDSWTWVSLFYSLVVGGSNVSVHRVEAALVVVAVVVVAVHYRFFLCLSLSLFWCSPVWLILWTNTMFVRKCCSVRVLIRMLLSRSFIHMTITHISDLFS